eukprot:1536092-Amphidinium_carterae.1
MSALENKRPTARRPYKKEQTKIGGGAEVEVPEKVLSRSPEVLSCHDLLSRCAPFASDAFSMLLSGEPISITHSRHRTVSTTRRWQTSPRWKLVPPSSLSRH